MGSLQQMSGNFNGTVVHHPKVISMSSPTSQSTFKSDSRFHQSIASNVNHNSSRQSYGSIKGPGKSTAIDKYVKSAMERAKKSSIQSNKRKATLVDLTKPVLSQSRRSIDSKQSSVTRRKRTHISRNPNGSRLEGDTESSQHIYGQQRTMQQSFN
jgi:hypothetical protein